MNKHTPGPWQLTSGKYSLSYQLRRKNRSFASIHLVEFIDYNLPTERKITVEEARANARLMASAPELLGIAKEVLAVMTDILGPYDPLTVKLWSVIHKAEER